jgi:endonuclease/exonuclease/phosphatase (EEP) superfamily protein YafD
MLIIFQLLALTTIFATITSLLYKKKWWVRIFDFPRVQIFILQFISLAGILIFLNDKVWPNVAIIIVLVLTMIVQISYVYPYLWFTSKSLENSSFPPKETISLIVANVLMSNRKSSKLIKLVKEYRPDIFLAVETDKWWSNELSVLDELFKHNVKIPQENTYGMILYCRYDLKNTEIRHIIKESVPSIHTDVKLNQFEFKLRCLHPEPPAPGEAETSHPRDRELVRMAKLIKEQPKPHIVVGDLNDVAWSDTSYRFERISELEDPRQGRGFFNTFHAKTPFIRWALDHIFVSREFKVITLKRLPAFGSDHFPMYFKFGIE